jgi:hypothetical protein
MDVRLDEPRRSTEWNLATSVRALTALHPWIEHDRLRYKVTILSAARPHFGRERTLIDSLSHRGAYMVVPRYNRTR